MDPMANRDIEVTLFGATSVTGRQIAKYLAHRAPGVGATWAAAARSPEKLSATLADVGVEGATTVAADVTDPDSLRAMAERTKVVLNLVGPYTSYGRPVIDACIAGGAHYIDLSGEMPFVARTTRDLHDAAEAAGVKVVQVCGFESLPPDMGVALAAHAAQEQHSEDLASAEVTIRTLQLPPGLPRLSDMVSGGTMQSLAQALGEDDAERLLDPSCMVFDEARCEEIRRVSPIKIGPRRSHDGAVIAPMAPAAFINPAVIHRSAALDDRPVFIYREGMAIDGGTASLPFRYVAAGALSGMQVATATAAGARPAFRKRASSILTRILPGSGFGPSPDRIEQWRWRLDVNGATTTGNTVHVRVDADGHPGYLATSRMMGEAGLVLADESLAPDRAGCLTPSVALGAQSAERFDSAGLRFRVS
jgi:short subunit dehydrogenase-like uncharacterized protein